jgi:hypothetical protein
MYLLKPEENQAMSTTSGLIKFSRLFDIATYPIKLERSVSLAFDMNEEILKRASERLSQKRFFGRRKKSSQAYQLRDINRTLERINYYRDGDKRKSDSPGLNTEYDKHHGEFYE